MNKLDLNSKTWQLFNLGGLNSFFTIHPTKSSIDKNKLNLTPGNTPYVTRKDTCNGIDSFITLNQGEHELNQGNVITIGLDTQTVFYQPHKFFTGKNIQILSYENINKYNALFIIVLLRKQLAKLHWGGNGATLTRLKRMKILLPVNRLGYPDWLFMKNYMRQQEQKMLTRFKSHIHTCICVDTIRSLPRNWEDFTIEEVFTIHPGKQLENRNKTIGYTPFVGATKNGNGITGFVGNINSSKDSNVLGVNYNGTPCTAFYHPYECLFSSDVKRFHLKNYEDNKYVLLFFTIILEKQRIKYNYDYKFSEERMLRQKLVLPVTDSREPDYEYMEQYIKNMILKKYEQYLGFITHKLL